MKETPELLAVRFAGLKMKKPLKLLPVIFASALLAAPSFAAFLDYYSFDDGGAGFNIEFVNIGYANNGGTTVNYGSTPNFDSNGQDGFGVSGYDAPSKEYGSVEHTYGIGKYEITIDQFSRANAASGGQIGNGDENLWNDSTINDWNGNPLSVGPDAPATLVTWNEAARFANWLSSGSVSIGVYQFDGNGNISINRSYRNDDNLAFILPNEDEWYKAAYYKPIDDGTYSTYSSGLDTSPTVGASDGWNYNPAHQLQHVWEVGSGTNEQHGTFDMMGNVWEWTETAAFSTNYVVRGGSAWSSEEYLDSDTYRLISEKEESNIGFRVAVIPEPSTIGFMAVMGVAIFGIRRIFSL